MGLISWIVFGAIVGWIASMIMNRNDRMGCLANIATGVIGGVVGGFLANIIGGHGVSGFNVSSFVVAIIGAVIFLGITGWRAVR
ncbi:MAG: GlsB/YeaQ/YmgE family stress response membrane protein [Caldilineaceae bacterium]|nr:GlsB/YeaQ/YmgE family stress response membrane protein [Caldilineaceae bacterium]